MTGVFSKILVPIDGSPNSYRGLRYAVDIARKYGSEVTMIHVVENELMRYGAPTTVPIPEKYFIGIEESAKSLLKKRTSELRTKGIKVGTILARGNAVQEILRASKGYDLIVIGSRGMGGFKRLLLGSVSSGVLQHSSVPVLVVRPGKTANTPA